MFYMCTVNRSDHLRINFLYFFVLPFGPCR